MKRRSSESPLQLARRVYGFWLLTGLALLPGLPQLFVETRALGPMWLWLLVLPGLCLLLSLVLPAASVAPVSHPVRHTRSAGYAFTASRRRRSAQRSGAVDSRVAGA